MKKGIIFDLDGTLWDSTEQVVKSWNHVMSGCEDTGCIMTTEIMEGLMGKTIKEIAGIILSDVTEERGLEIMKGCCIEETAYLNKHGGVLYPKLEETLKELSESYGLYIVSNCQEGYIESFLKYHGLEKYFIDFENHGRTNLSKGENIKLIMKRNKLDKAVYVGDTQGDCDAAGLAGIPFIHASYGFGSVNRKIYSINNINELPELIKKGRQVV
ncbi:MAG TPA: HAD family hydrolase [Clostridiales bacterium]|nr:HAD family hydrolase [Clostridiales bacterium]